MKIEVRFRGLKPSEPLRDHAMRQIHSHMGRFGRELTGVVVRIDDINGPKGGVDKRCHLNLRGRRVGAAAFEEHSADAYSAVDFAVERAARSVGRELERARTNRRHDQSAMRRAS